MSQVIRWILALAILTCAEFSQAQSSCLPNFTALQTIEQIPSSFMRPLISKRGDQEFTTKVRLEGSTSTVEGGILQLRVMFDPQFQGVSLPYNLYAIFVAGENGEVLAWHDFTRGCTGVGIGFFPGRVIDLPPIKLLRVQSQKLQIMVWGKL